MADKTYDAVIIGGGAKGLITGMYLAKYGGMEVAIFDQKHEMGGGWCSDEGSVPGFVFDYHCVGVRPYYHFATERDFPEWKEEYGHMTRMVDVKTGLAGIFKEDQSSLITYNLLEDPTQDRTAKSIARFSQKDADTWRRLMELYRLFAPSFVEWVHSPPVAPEEMDILDRLSMDKRFDPSWPGKSLIGVLRDLFESDALISLLLRGALSGGRPAELPGMGVVQLMWTLGIALQAAYVSHGAHNMAHTAVKIFLANGGKLFTRHAVEKVTIENGKATGIRLVDGTEVKARKLVLSTLDPYSLCFRLTGKEYYDPGLLSRVEKLERRYTVIDYFHWAFKEKPKYIAADANPDINETDAIYLIPKDPEATIRENKLRLSRRRPHRPHAGGLRLRRRSTEVSGGEIRRHDRAVHRGGKRAQRRPVERTRESPRRGRRPALAAFRSERNVEERDQLPADDTPRYRQEPSEHGAGRELGGY